MNSLPPAISVLKRASSTDIRTKPFPYIHIEKALPNDYYRRLAETFPGRDLILEGKTHAQNAGLTYSGIETIINPDAFPPLWVSFMKYHLSTEFFREILKLFGKHFQQRFPDFEARLGKPLTNATVGPRVSNAPFDIRLDCQFAVNSPVTAPSTVRGPHIDKNNKLFNALLYMRMDGDDSTGADFEIYELKAAPTFGARDDRFGVPEEITEPVALVPYRANSLALFMNSPTSVHGVTPRSVTSVPRQYINFLAEARIPVFPFPP